MNLFFARCCFIFTLLFSSFVYAKTEKLIFNRPADTPQSRYIIDVITLAYQKQGIDIELIDFNKENALVAANEGLLDGQLAKIPGLSQTYQNLMRIEVPLLDFDLNLISFCDNCTLPDMPSLVIHSTYPAAAKYLESNPYHGQLYKVKSVSTLLNLLMQKQVSAALVIGFYIDPYMQKLQNADVKFTTVHSQSVFHYLHKKHQHLAPQLFDTLQQLKKSGKMQELKSKHNL
jgi:hypothetical protein